MGSVRKASQESLSHSLCSTSVRKASQESLACSLHLLLCHTPGLSRERGGSPQGLCLLGFHQPFRPEELWIIPESQPGISKSEGAMSTRIALAVAHHPFLCVQRRVSTPFPSCPARHRGETEAGEAGGGCSLEHMKLRTPQLKYPPVPASLREESSSHTSLLEVLMGYKRCSKFAHVAVQTHGSLLSGTQGGSIGRLVPSETDRGDRATLYNGSVMKCLREHLRVLSVDTHWGLLCVNTAHFLLCCSVVWWLPLRTTHYAQLRPNTQEKSKHRSKHWSNSLA